MAKGVSIDLIVDPKKAISGLDSASSHAGKTTELFKSLGKIGATALAALGTAAVAAAGGLAAATRSAAAYADDILTTATNTNLSTDALQAYKYAAELTDVSFDTFTKSQGKFTKSMMDATRSSVSPAAEAFQALGLSVTDADGNLVDSTKLYWQAVDALGNVANETERTALAQQIFGKSGADMNSLIQIGSEKFAELTEEARKNGAIMSGEQLDALGAFDDQMQRLTSTTAAAKNALGLTLLPVLDDLAGSGSNALGQFTSALLDANGDLSKAAPAFESLGSTIGDALTKAIPKILQVGSSLVTGLIQGIVKQLPALIRTGIPLIVQFANGLLAMLPTILDAGLKILVALAQGIAASLPQLIPAAVAAVVGLVGALVDNLPMLIDAGIQLVVALAVGLIDALPQLIEKLPVLITSVIAALIGAIPQLVAAGIQLFVAIVKNMPAILAGIVGAVPQIVDGIVETLGDPKFWKAMGDAGLQLIKGLWEGIKGAGAWLWNQVMGFFNGIVDNIKNFFGIHSPSTVFAGFGLNMIKGLENGLTGPNHLGAITDSLGRQVTEGFQGSLVATAKATVGMNASSSGSGGVTIYVQGGLDSAAEIGRRVSQALNAYRASGGRIAF